MTTARSVLVDEDSPGYYHCISRCVRQAWLCGVDRYNGKSCEHRREWVEDRFLELAEIYAVGIYAYAVMSNHVHVVLRIDPDASAEGTAEEVAARWVRLFPATVDGQMQKPDGIVFTGWQRRRNGDLTFRTSLPRSGMTCRRNV